MPGPQAEQVRSQQQPKQPLQPLQHLQQQQEAEGGKLVTFYRNGDSHFRGLGVSISHRAFASIATLTAWLNEKISTPSGIRHVFRLPDGRQIAELPDFESGGHYVVSSSPKLVRSVEYGGHRVAWRMKPPSAKVGRRTRDDLRLVMDPGRTPEDNHSRRHGGIAVAPAARAGAATRAAAGPAKSRSVIIISNSHRQSREKLLISPSHARSLDAMLEDLSSLLVIADPPLTCLYTAYPPYRKVTKFSQLFNEYKDYDSFIACGQEFLPSELRNRPLEAAAVWAADEFIGGTSDAPTAANGEWRLGGGGGGGGGVGQRARRLEPLAPRSEAANGAAPPPPPPLRLPPPAPPPPPPPPQWPRTGQDAAMDERQMQRLQQLQQEQRLALQQRLGDSSPAAVGRYEAAEESGGSEVDEDEPPVVASARGESQPSSVSVRIRGSLYTFQAPAAQPKAASNRQHLQPPDLSLSLEWVYGFNSSAGLLTLPTGDLLYSSGNVLVLLDTRRSRQRHYTEHTALVTCIAAHPVNAYIASGQAASGSGVPAQIRIWDAESLETCVVLSEGHLQAGIASLSFSGESMGAYLLAVDALAPGRKQTLTVFDWSARRLVVRSQAARDRITRAAFHPEDDSVIVSVGSERASFWRIFHDSAGRSRALRDKKSGLSMGSLPAEMTAVAFDLVGNVVTGDSLGRLQLWCRDQDDAFVLRPVERLKHAHTEAISSLHVLGDGALVSSSAKHIHVWDTLNGYSHVKEALITTVVDGIATLALKHPRSLDGRLVIGTLGNCILEGSLHDQFFCLVQGHAPGDAGPVVCAHPREPELVTCGAAPDRTVCRWSTGQCRLTWRVTVEDACACAAYHPRGHLLLLGTATGRIVALQHARGEYAMSSQVTDRGQAVLCARFNDNGRLLALGTGDGRIYLMSVEENGLVYRKYRDGILVGHSSPVTRLDFSIDSATIRSQSEDMETRFWSVPNMGEVSADSVTNVKYSSESCFITYNHAAAWQMHNSSDTALTCSCLSGRADLLCVGDSSGRVSLFRYPPHPQQSQGLTIEALATSVREAVFAFDDSKLFVTDRAAGAVLQWSVLPDRA